MMLDVTHTIIGYHLLMDQWNHGLKKMGDGFSFYQQIGGSEKFPPSTSTTRATRRSLLMNLSLRAMAWNISTVLAGQKTTIRTASCQTLSSLAMKMKEVHQVDHGISTLSGYEGYEKSLGYPKVWQTISIFEIPNDWNVVGPSSDPRSKKKNDCGNWRNKGRLVNCREWRNLLSIALRRLGTRTPRAPCNPYQ